jgi:hypothetical protein
VTERKRAAVFEHLRQAIASLDATRANSTAGLPDTVRALLEWRQAFTVLVRGNALKKARR